MSSTRMKLAGKIKIIEWNKGWCETKKKKQKKKKKKKTKKQKKKQKKKTTTLYTLKEYDMRIPTDEYNK